MNFGKEHIENDDVFHIVEMLFDVVPEVLKKHGKAKNPWPNVDAASRGITVSLWSYRIQLLHCFI
ncbi:MAG: hypothetical protein CM1200mP10_10270 [Candidatus Neomarinimicrobiota bacterium]|nr:MAG: hypothetical protein CM1200mP10_10270 [Candidatus Neomarinimicrobiota bacterium]